MRNVQLPEKIQEAIQEKLQAQQESQRKERQEVERKRIEAKGIADFQRVASQGLNHQLLQYKGIDTTEELAQSAVIISAGERGLPVTLQPDITSASCWVFA